MSYKQSMIVNFMMFSLQNKMENGFLLYREKQLEWAMLMKFNYTFPI